MGTISLQKLAVAMKLGNLGDMYDFAVHSLEYSISEFHKMFIASGMASQFEIANPTYVAGPKRH